MDIKTGFRWNAEINVFTDNYIFGRVMLGMAVYLGIAVISVFIPGIDELWYALFAGAALSGWGIPIIIIAAFTPIAVMLAVALIMTGSGKIRYYYELRDYSLFIQKTAGGRNTREHTVPWSAVRKLKAIKKHGVLLIRTARGRRHIRCGEKLDAIAVYIAGKSGLEAKNNAKNNILYIRKKG